VLKTGAFMAIWIVGAAGVFAAGASPELSVADCPVAAPRPTVDGFLNDACWQRAGRLTDFKQAPSNDPVEYQTEVAVACDNAKLYIAVRVHEPTPASLVGKRRGRDLDIANDDIIAIAIRPNTVADHTFHILVSSAGALTDRKDRDPAWNADLQMRTFVADAHWTAEMGISLKSLGVEFAEGTILGINFRRNDRVRDVRSRWAPGRGGYILLGHAFISPAPHRSQRPSPLMAQTPFGTMTLYANAASAGRLLQQLSPRVTNLSRGAKALLKNAFEAETVRARVAALVDRCQAIRAALYESIPHALTQRAAAVPKSALGLRERLDALAAETAQLEPEVRLAAIFAKQGTEAPRRPQ